MSKLFRPWDVDQEWLLPPSVHDFVPAGHIAHFVRDTVREGLDLSSLLSTYKEERGSPPYHPAMMTALLLYAYSQGVYSSRRIARACQERVDFMAVTGLSQPDFRTISDFRKRHLKALSGLFKQVLGLCRRAGLAKLGHVALDGTKIKANASKHKAMSYGRMAAAEAKLAAEVAGWMRQAEAADKTEDRQQGAEQRGDETPDWVASRERRLAKIREAKAALEAEARAAAAGPGRDGDGPGGSAAPVGEACDPAEAEPAGATPAAKAQRNFTDPQSRIMKTKDGFIQGYNAQAAVDADHQIIVACDLSNQGADSPQLLPLVDQIQANTDAMPQQVSADAGYASDANLEGLDARKIDGFVAMGRQKHGTDAPAAGSAKPGSRRAAMAEKIAAEGHDSPYRLRKQTVEPVFGQIKQARGFRQFLLRGVEQVRAEWALVCTVHNLLKLELCLRPQPMVVTAG
jgi:transposase